jgi:hypothetical protein
MNESVFQPDAFLDQTTEQEGSTYVTPCPVGEFRAVISKDVAFREEESKKKPGEKFYLCDILWMIEDSDVEAQLGRKPIVRQSIFVDIKDGKLDFSEGKNVALNRVRDAVGQNRSGMAWSPRMLTGQMATVQVNQRADDNDPKIIYNDVKRVGSL